VESKLVQGFFKGPVSAASLKITIRTELNRLMKISDKVLESIATVSRHPYLITIAL